LSLRPMHQHAADVVWLIGADAAETPIAPDDSTVTPEAALLKLWALEQLPIPMSLFDVHGMRIEANAAMALLLDRSGSDVIGLGERREQYRTSPPPRANVRRRWTRPAHRRADRTTLG